MTPWIVGSQSTLELLSALGGQLIRSSLISGMIAKDLKMIKII